MSSFLDQYVEQLEAVAKCTLARTLIPTYLEHSLVSAEALSSPLAPSIYHAAQPTKLSGLHCLLCSLYPSTGMIEAAARLREEIRPRVAISLKIDYTRQATRFGCRQVQTSSGLLWKSEVTKAHTRGRPRFDVGTRGK